MRTQADLLSAHAEQAEGLLKVLSNQHRLMILCCLGDQEMNVSQLNKRIQLAQSALSQHLATLRKAGIVATRRHKQTIVYRVVNHQALAVIATLHQLFCKES